MSSGVHGFNNLLHSHKPTYLQLKIDLPLITINQVDQEFAPSPFDLNLNQHKVLIIIYLQLIFIIISQIINLLKPLLYLTQVKNLESNGLSRLFYGLLFFKS